jgi:hypothetical protein
VALAALLLVATAVPGARGETITWATGADGSWHSATNWNPQDVPNEPGEVALIPASGGAYSVTINSGLTLDAIHNDNAEATLVINGRSLYLSGGLRNSGIFRVNWGTLDGPFENRGGGVVRIPAGMNFWHYGSTFLNDGIIYANSDQGSSDVELKINYPGTSLDGAGVIYLQTAGYYLDAQLTGQAITQQASHTIRGDGYIAARITNYGTISADHPGGRVLLLADYSKTNHGTMKATAGGVLRLATGVTQGPTGRTIADGGTIQLDALAALTGGTLEALGGGRIELVSWPANLTDLAILGGISIPGGNRLYLSGAIRNEGAIVVNSNQAAADAYLQISSPVSLTGEGEVVLQTAGSFADARISGGQTLTQEPGHIIRGEGYVGVPLVNNGTVVADHPGGRALRVAEYSQVNNATMMATGGGRLEFTIQTTNNGLVVANSGGTVSLSGGVFNNLGTLEANGGTFSVEPYFYELLNNGVAQAKGGGLFRATDLLRHYDAVTHTLTGGSWRVYENSTMRLLGMPISNNAAEILFDGPGSRIYSDAGTTEALAGLTRNAATGSLVVRNDASLTIGGSVENSGEVTTDSGGTLTIAGVYTQVLGRTSVGGNLVAPSTVLSGGRLEGTGSLSTDLVNGATVAPGNSVGTLHLAGDFVQTAGGWLEIEVLGTEEGAFDRLDIEGNATLGGTLVVPSREGAMVNDGDSVTVMTFASRTGIFDRVMGCPAPAICVDEVYTDTSLVLVIRRIAPAGVEGGSPPDAIRLAARSDPGGSIVCQLDLPDESEVDLALFDVSGRRIGPAIRGTRPAGQNEIRFGDAGDLPSGIYFTRAIVRSVRETVLRKATVLVMR